MLFPSLVSASLSPGAANSSPWGAQGRPQLFQAALQNHKAPVTESCVKLPRQQRVYYPGVLLPPARGLFNWVDQRECNCYFLKFRNFWCFSGSQVVKNPLANAEDMGSIPAPGRACTPQQERCHSEKPQYCN